MPRRLALVLLPLAATFALHACADDDFGKAPPATDLNVEVSQPDLRQPVDLLDTGDMAMPAG